MFVSACIACAPQFRGIYISHVYNTPAAVLPALSAGQFMADCAQITALIPSHLSHIRVKQDTAWADAHCQTVLTIYKLTHLR